MTELFNIHFFILQACCYQGNNLRSKQKNQDKRSCFKGSKVYIRLPCIAVKCLIFVQAGHYLLKHLMSVFITIIVIINLLINLCMNYLMVCRRQISTCVKYYIETTAVCVHVWKYEITDRTHGHICMYSIFVLMFSGRVHVHVGMNTDLFLEQKKILFYFAAFQLI